MKPPFDLEAIKARTREPSCTCNRCQQEYTDSLALIAEVERLTKEREGLVGDVVREVS